MKVLVIEDEMSLLDAIKIRLIKEKYDVDTCIDEKKTRTISKGYNGKNK